MEIQQTGGFYLDTNWHQLHNLEGIVAGMLTKYTGCLNYRWQEINPKYINNGLPTTVHESYYLLTTLKSDSAEKYVESKLTAL